jgi:hypothetical protein
MAGVAMIEDADMIHPARAGIRYFSRRYQGHYEGGGFRDDYAGLKTIHSCS